MSKLNGRFECVECGQEVEGGMKEINDHHDARHPDQDKIDWEELENYNE
jgi:hypothetical protein